MKITNGNIGHDVSVNGTSLQGYVRSTYDALVAAFGEPQEGPNADIDGKVTCEWRMEADIDGKHVVATIYDWKVGRTPMGKYDWHIGGSDKRAATLVIDQLGLLANTTPGMLIDIKA